jgi:hypothetical protein
MGAAFVGSWTSAQFNNTTGGSLAGRTSTAGNFVAITASSNTTVSLAIAHSQAGTVQTGRAAENNGGDFITTRYVENIAGGASHTISITVQAGSFTTLNASEYSGVNTSATLDKTNVGTGNSATLLSAATATTAQADELLIGNGTLNTGSAGAWTAGASYNLRGSIVDGVNGSVSFLEDQIVTATGTYTAGATKNGESNAWICTVCTFKTTAGGTSASANAVNALVTVTANNPTNTVSSAAAVVNALVTVTATNPAASGPVIAPALRGVVRSALRLR